MADELEPGDKVAWDGSGGSSDGKVVKRLTATTRINGHVAKPTPHDPQYLIRSTKTASDAAHKPETLRRT